MHTPSPLAPRGLPVPGVIPEPVRVVDDTDAYPPTRHATPPTRADVAPDVHGNVPAGVRPAGKLDATSGPRGPRTESQTKEG